jgi:cell division septation protein DedD
MADEGFREIQLSGKQLAALFMGAAVLLVVTFLCGVLVGRGVRAQKDTAVATEALAPGASAAADPTAAATPPQPEASAPAAPPPSTTPPSPPPEDLSYYAKLEGKPGQQPAKSGSSVPAAKDPKAEKAGIQAKAVPAPSPVAPPASPAPASAAAKAPGEPPGEGYVVRVGAFKGKPQADALAAQLTAKGYGTWIVQLPDTTKGPGLYSVRVGKYKTSKEADAARRRLQKEGYKPSPTTR